MTGVCTCKHKLQFLNRSTAIKWLNGSDIQKKFSSSALTYCFTSIKNNYITNIKAAFETTLDKCITYSQWAVSLQMQHHSRPISKSTSRVLLIDASKDFFEIFNKILNRSLWNLMGWNVYFRSVPGMTYTYMYVCRKGRYLSNFITKISTEVHENQLWKRLVNLCSSNCNEIGNCHI